MRIHTLLVFLFLLAASSVFGQTTVTYNLLQGASPSFYCNNPENCNYEISNGADSGVFQASSSYNMQFQYRNSPTQNPGYAAEYCQGPGSLLWTSAATPDLGPTAFLFVMDCKADYLDYFGHINAGVTQMHAEIQAHSYVASYPCGGRVRTICKQTRWAIDEGSLTITKQ